ncbi:MAG: hypothetical protein ACYC3X_08430 [Pirellulaceae bacterium]
MHVRELVELGALVATHGILFMQRYNLLTKCHLEQYWLASHFRHERWAHAMKAFDQLAPTEARAAWSEMRPVIQEVLASELLTRTWAAVACCYDRRHQSSYLEPVVLSVLSSHLEARSRALQLVVRGHGASVEEGVVLNRLRRLTERWTDMLLGTLADNVNVAEFAFSAARASDFAADLRDERRDGTGDQPRRLAMASLRAAFEQGLPDASPNADLNERIAGSILACFHSEMLQASGMLKSHWLLRFNQIADDTEELLEDQLRLDQISAPRCSLPR